jgi:hypothetical protein
VNAVAWYAARMTADAARRLAALPVPRYAGGDGARRPRMDAASARDEVGARWLDDLCGLLNAMTRGELAALAVGLGAVTVGAASSADLRARLWDHGAELERAGHACSDQLQPRPMVLGGHLVVQAAPRGAFAASDAWPRLLPAPRAVVPCDGEPETLDALLAAADRAVGVRLGARGADKGAWGMRTAALLGVVERGEGEPDWLGDVEIKTVSVAREPSGLWRVREDPAIAMYAPGTAALAKLQRTLWLARADVGDDATIVSWYLLECDAQVSRLVHRYLHVRPKGPRGTDQRGLYLHKRFFADAGLLATLNGPPR